MSSGNLVRTAHPELFHWSSDLDPADYLLATYRVAAATEPAAVAEAMALEQSAATVRIRGYLDPGSLRDWTIRVRSVRPAAVASAGDLPTYTLSTEVYAGAGTAGGGWDIELAVPLRLLHGKPAQALNVLVGELPRLGFLKGFRLLQADLPPAFGPGPAFGAEGILALLGQPRGPLLCRSMRPGVGVDTATQARLHQDVLTGGFHLVKDDELACHADTEAFRAHLRAMLRARDAARDRTGERKLFVANLICEPEELDTRWEIALELGVDAALVAPFIQGLGLLPKLARQARIPLLAHNTFGDLLGRHPGWGLADAALCNWLRRFGADWVVTPGPFGSPSQPAEEARDFLAAARGPLPGARPLMPILQGGKHPGDLAAYRAAMGTDAFMLIVASWVDGHPEGLEAAARIFRAAVDA